jgi:hypothetical protein
VRRYALVNAVEGLVDGAAGGERGDDGHQRDQGQDCDIAGDAHGERAEQGRGLVAAWRAGKPGIDGGDDAEQRDGAAAADGAAFEAEQEKVTLELA